MKTFIIALFSVLAHTYAGVLPASTTLLQPNQYTYNPHPLAVAYRAPLAYSPTLYSQPLLAPSQPFLAQRLYSSPIYSHAPVLGHQSLLTHYPGLVAQSPVFAQYPLAQAPGIGQYPVQVPGGAAGPIQGGSPVIEAADGASPPGIAPQPPQQSPILGGAFSGTAVDDDTVSIEAV